MPKKSLKRLAERAFRKQHGVCYYCQQPMWLQSTDELLHRYPITEAAAKHLKCTGEHLHPRSLGGPEDQSNIVAACHFCNSKRDKVGRQIEPLPYRAHVHKRLARGKWHGIMVKVKS